MLPTGVLKTGSSGVCTRTNSALTVNKLEAPRCEPRLGVRARPGSLTPSCGPASSSTCSPTAAPSPVLCDEGRHICCVRASFGTQHDAVEVLLAPVIELCWYVLRAMNSPNRPNDAVCTCRTQDSTAVVLYDTTDGRFWRSLSRATFHVDIFCYLD